MCDLIWLLAFWQRRWGIRHDTYSEPDADVILRGQDSALGFGALCQFGDNGEIRLTGPRLAFDA